MHVSIIPRTAFGPASLIACTLACVIGTPIAQQCSAASECDVNIIKVNSVEIEDDKITISAEASIGMVTITPELPNAGKEIGRIGHYVPDITIKKNQFLPLERWQACFLAGAKPRAVA